MAPRHDFDSAARLSDALDDLRRTWATDPSTHPGTLLRVKWSADSHRLPDHYMDPYTLVTKPSAWPPEFEQELLTYMFHAAAVVLRQIVKRLSPADIMGTIMDPFVPANQEIYAAVDTWEQLIGARPLEGCGATKWGMEICDAALAIIAEACSALIAGKGPAAVDPARYKRLQDLRAGILFGGGQEIRISHVMLDGSLYHVSHVMGTYKTDNSSGRTSTATIIQQLAFTTSHFCSAPLLEEFTNRAKNDSKSPLSSLRGLQDHFTHKLQVLPEVQNHGDAKKEMHNASELDGELLLRIMSGDRRPLALYRRDRP